MSEPIVVRPLGTVEALVQERQRANFVVEWGAAKAISEPIIEAVALGWMGTQGYSLVTQAGTWDRLRLLVEAPLRHAERSDEVASQSTRGPSPRGC
jgi:hypothetical protein